MRELQVPTRRVSVHLTTKTGERLSGHVFAPESPYLSTDAEHLRAVLQDERTFIPFHTGDGSGGCFVINKRQIVHIELPYDAHAFSDHVDDDPLPPPCRLQLDDASSLTGRLIVETRRSCSRAVDKLNQAGPFVGLLGDDTLHFVLRDRIVRVD